MKFRKKSVVIEAIQYQREGNIFQVQDFVTDGSLQYDPEDNEYFIKTLEGNMKLNYKDWIIKGVKGEFYPCKPDIFEAIYEEAKE